MQFLVDLVVEDRGLEAYSCAGEGEREGLEGVSVGFEEDAEGEGY